MRYPNGLFGWVDLMTRDTATAARFYEGLFGWTHVDQPTPMGPPYTQFFKDGQLVCGMSPMMPGVPETIGAFWNSYVIVEDIQTTLDRVLPAGGSITMPAMQVMDQGWMAMVADPTGAIVGLWQPGAHEGAEVFNIPGSSRGTSYRLATSRPLCPSTPQCSGGSGRRGQTTGTSWPICPTRPVTTSPTPER